MSATRWRRGWGWVKYEWRHAKCRAISFWRDFIVNVVAQNGRETTSLFTDDIWWRGMFFELETSKDLWGKIWRRKVEKCKSIFPSKGQENTVSQRRARQPLRVNNGLVDRSRICQEVTGSSRRTLLISEGREERLLSANEQANVQEEAARKEKALEFRARTSRLRTVWEPGGNEHCWSRARISWKLSKPGRTVQHEKQPTAIFVARRIQYLHNRRWAINPENPGLDNKDWAPEWKAAFHRFEENLRLARSRGL